MDLQSPNFDTCAFEALAFVAADEAVPVLEQSCVVGAVAVMEQCVCGKIEQTHMYTLTHTCTYSCAACTSHSWGLPVTPRVSQ